MESPVRVAKVGMTKLTSLKILEEQHLGSLTCHVLRDPSKPSAFDSFAANSTTEFSSRPDTYDPHVYGRRRRKTFRCDVYLLDADFPDDTVDLDLVLILQPLLKVNEKNLCDTPLIARQTVQFIFESSSSDPLTLLNQVSTTTTLPPQLLFPVTVQLSTSIWASIDILNDE